MHPVRWLALAALTASIALAQDDPIRLRSQADPLLEVDLTSKASLEAAGIDPAGPLTVSRPLLQQ